MQRGWTGSLGLITLMVVVGALPACEDGGAPGNEATDPADQEAAVVFEADTAWGDAPLSTTLRWEIASTASPTCRVDLDGDGTYDETLSPCPAEGHRDVTFEDPGEHNPALAVTFAEGAPVDKHLRVFANDLQLVDEAVQVGAPGSGGSFERDGSRVTVHLDGDTASAIDVGSILLSNEGQGLLVRVTQVLEADATSATVETTPAALDEVIEEGFFGVIAARPPAEQLAADPGGELPSGKADFMEFQHEESLSTPAMPFSSTIGQIAIEGDAGSAAIRDAVFEATARAGIDTFVMKKGLGSPLKFDVAFWSAIEWSVTADVMAALGATWRKALPEVPLGFVQAGPVTITFDLEPAIYGALELSTGVSASASGGVFLQGGAQNQTGTVEPYGAREFDANLEVSPLDGQVADGSLKVGLSARLKTQAYSMAGPFAEVGAYARGTVEQTRDETCTETALGVEATVGGELEFFSLLDVELAYTFDPIEWILGTACAPFSPGPGPCQPDCSGRECGLDPMCGESCGACSDDRTCKQGQCLADACTADCSGRECGLDPICGESCGTCADNQVCEDGVCLTLERFVDLEDGTILDTETGLTWHKDVAKKDSITSAIAYCDSFGSGWRVPFGAEFPELCVAPANGGDGCSLNPAFDGPCGGTDYSSATSNGYLGHHSEAIDEAIKFTFGSDFFECLSMQVGAAVGGWVRCVKP
ncbi:MAG: hypothetical protein ACQEXJ_21610 [Myxococcota bacterium]